MGRPLIRSCDGPVQSAILVDPRTALPAAPEIRGDGTCRQTKPGLCPQRVKTRPASGDVKSRAGRRTIGLPPQLVALLPPPGRAGTGTSRGPPSLDDEGRVFATPAGEALTPNTDYYEWKRLLKEAGLREGRLHHASTRPPPSCWSCASRTRP
jgi:hypothetical protein